VLTLPTLDAVTDLLSSYRFSGRNEEDYQDAVEDVLVKQGVQYEREVWLTPRDRIDFLVEPGWGVEVKVDGSRSEHLRQLGRYATSERVQGLVLASSRLALLADIPPAIHDVPLRTLHLRGRLM
jgi:hypothetical protein